MFSKILTFAAAALSTSNAAYLRGSYNPGIQNVSVATRMTTDIVLYRRPSPPMCLPPPPVPWYAAATAMGSAMTMATATTNSTASASTK